MHARDIRSGFLDYFERQGHRSVASSSLVPVDDPTLLFTNAGMNQFKDLFLGREAREYRRAASSQKCMRVSGKHNDLENVGPSPRHHTFFEMLGNFSFGDYFKADAIEFAWTLLTDVWKIEPERLHATVFGGEAGVPADAEARALWRRFLPEERILDLGLADNFWQMGDTGPCGPCSELHFYRDAGPVPATPRADDDRYMEVWNLVFMEFDRAADGVLTPLPAKSIDTGMGLERITAVLQGKRSNYDTDIFQPLLGAIAEAAGLRYGQGQRTPLTDDADTSMRVIADHLRAMTFLIGDGVVPSNEWRGYVLRKIMRRAMRHGKKLMFTQPMMHIFVGTVVKEMSGAYPELIAQRDAIAAVVHAEEARFDKVLTDGLPRLDAALAHAKAAGTPLQGDEAFRLYDTFGLPRDFIEDTAESVGVAIDQAGYERAMEAQRARARSASSFELKRGEAASPRSPGAASELLNTGDHFEGYESLRIDDAVVVALFDEARRQVDRLEPGAEGYVLLDRTPFYLESGGQVSDTGDLVLRDGPSLAQVTGMARLSPGWPRGHRVTVEGGALREGDVVSARVDSAARQSTRRNHSATHLLHAALRQVLGGHVKQAGSLVAPDRLRFDFAHFAPITPDDLTRIERIVNEHVWENTKVDTEEKSTQDAIAAGAMALFGEKYGDRVRVVSMGNFSLELCGGTHVRATGDIGLFTITDESGVAAGVRRIEATTGAAALERVQTSRRAFQRVLGALNASESSAADMVQRLHLEIKKLTRDLQQVKIQAASRPASDTQADTFEIAGAKVVMRRADGLDRAGLRALSDSIREGLQSGVIVLAAATDEKVALVASVSRDLTARVKAGEIVKALAPLVGGSGGGRPEFAEAGGKDPAKIDDMLIEGRAVVSRLLSTS